MTLRYVPDVPGVFPTAEEAVEHARMLLKGKAPSKAKKGDKAERPQPQTDEKPTEEVS